MGGQGTSKVGKGHGGGRDKVWTGKVEKGQGIRRSREGKGLGKVGKGWVGKGLGQVGQGRGMEGGNWGRDAASTDQCKSLPSDNKMIL